ncbi:hypothetical protein BDU57DRAFT_510752 [Ampelomyces quisqualis]|uniref:Uncharacterized protein n=1 Tax=Ampelomyces quisqualis TaxID=50730 RepID=A0A6A5R157_AMPQU|nr:hypothetical protein BDU57DRAFT_510752 [Ampelomyces quisqualis]
MRLSLLTPVFLALTATSLAAPVDDCTALKSLAILPGAKMFCAEKFPATTSAPVVDGTPKNNAKRFKEDNERVVRVLGGMPEQRQKAFCACYPAAKQG